MPRCHKKKGGKLFGGDIIFWLVGGEKSPKKLKRNNKGLELVRFWLVEKKCFLDLFVLEF